MPQSPATDPTDRSMPALRMTNVIPIAKMALMATCLTRITRFPVVRKSGDSTENVVASSTSAMRARSRITSDTMDLWAGPRSRLCMEALRVGST
jgi:hypothetical protein